MIDIFRVVIFLISLHGCAKPVEKLPFNIDPTLVVAIIEVESKGNPFIIHPKSKATGLMQIIPSTARYLGYTQKDMLNPIKNIEAGTRYLGILLDECNQDIECALRTYNCGAKNQHRPACHRYAKKVMKIYNE